MRKNLFLFNLILILLVFDSSHAQIINPSQNQLFVKQIRITGNETLPTSNIRNIIRTRTNREFLNIPNFRPWYWLWKLTKRVGEPPHLLNRDLIATDIDRIKAFYESRGFLEAKIDTTVIQFNKTDVEVSFLINEGKQSEIRTVNYRGLNVFNSEKERYDFLANSTLTDKQIEDSLYSSKSKFTYEAINSERNRIINHLKDNGYASVNKDSIRFLIKRDSTENNQLDVQIRTNQGRKFFFGNVKIYLSGPKGESNFVQQTQWFTQGSDSQKITVHISPNAGTKFKILRNQLEIEPFQLFNNSNYLESVNSIQNLGIANLRRFSLSDQGGLPNYIAKNLPVTIDLPALPNNSVCFNVFGFQRFGLGAGAGLTYLNRNFLGNAEQLEIALKGSFEFAQTDNDQKLLGSTEATIGYAVPSLNFPFGFLDGSDGFRNTRTVYQVSLSRINQFNFNIEANIGFNLKYEANHTSKKSSSFDLFEIDVVDAEATPEFLRELDNNANLTPLQRELIRQDFKPQINSQIRYSFRNINTDILKHDSGYYLESAIELGGTLPYLADKFLFSPDTTSSSIPSFGDSDLTYEQFVKLSLDYRKYIPYGDKTVFMYKTFAGYAIPFGQSSSIPLIRRFFAGGAADIRGWAPATLGPGPIQDNVSQTNGGEIKLASFVEIRQEIFENVINAKWQFATFADAGNIWNGPANPNIDSRFKLNEFYKQIALGSGIGLRLDWDYLIFRVDAAFRIREPNNTNWFRDKNIYWFFGIGHAF